MGGWGSGRREYATTPTVEECRKLDISNLQDLTETVGGQGAVWWGDREDPAATITVHPRGDSGLEDEERPSRFRLKYMVTNPRTGESDDLDYTVPLEYTEPNFGGVRPWFQCPECGTRRRTLYLPPRGEDRFLCRECYGLGYLSSRRSGDEMTQAELRYRRAFSKADAENRRPHPNNSPYYPTKPKGMHRETFDDLLEEVREARKDWGRVVYRRERKIINRVRE